MRALVHHMIVWRAHVLDNPSAINDLTALLFVKTVQLAMKETYVKGMYEFANTTLWYAWRFWVAHYINIV
jgi:hypothetical protein